MTVFGCIMAASGITLDEVQNLSFDSVYSTTAGSLYAIHRNPAGLGIVDEERQILGHCVRWYDAPLTGAGLSFLDATTELGSLALGLTYWNGRGDVDDNEFNYNLSYALELPWEVKGPVYLGAGIELVNSDLTDEDKLRVRAGALKPLLVANIPMNFGFVIRNIGTGNGPRPLTFEFGVGARLLDEELEVMADAIIPVENESAIKLGAAYTYQGRFIFRGNAYLLSCDATGFSLGAGMRLLVDHEINVDYGYNDAARGRFGISALARF